MKRLLILIVSLPVIGFSQTENSSIFDTVPETGDTAQEIVKTYPNVEFVPTFDIGVAGYVENDLLLDPGPYAPHQIGNSISIASTELDFSQSRNFALNFNVAFNLTKNVGIVTGAGLSFNSYGFKQNVVINPVHGSFSYDSVTTYSKYRFKNNYVQMPILIKVQSANEDFQFAAGPILGYRFLSKTKAVYEVGSTEYKNFEKDNFSVNPLKLSVGARFNYKGLGLYFNYGLTNLLQGAKYENPQIKSYELMPFEVGVTIGSF